MELVKIGMSGTMESSDINIVIGPSDAGVIEIDLQSSVEKQFGKQIRKVIEDTLKKHNINSAMVKAVDKGAIDYVIKARTETALFRAADRTDFIWEE
ncbi:citrate lyase acyl carrier protein [Tissierella sp. Yu-01]|uniref:citrate lyase acyl carrier protein n=1 Tax=Tissierella sp. Yu-01 TaxID=3035694 RepID=UPI00240D7998|nr:citrate lyase acyl carrier protein [Tissierella sp. Yu-01]WFA08130.1 citrate lyase acyl carrier protein [Tissierella sp. Yu-01]